MSVEANVRHIAGVSIFDLTGRMVVGSESSSLHDLLFRAFEHGNYSILLNCAGLSYVDSAGLGDLVSAYAAIVRRGGMVRLLHPNKRLVKLLAHTGLDSVIDIHYEEPMALASFNSANNLRTKRKLIGYLTADMSDG